MIVMWLGLFAMGMLGACSLGSGSDSANEPIPTQGPAQVLPTTAPSPTSTPIPPLELEDDPAPAVQVNPVTNVTACDPPDGWSTYTVLAGDTLFGIATAYGTSSDNLAEANCLRDASSINVGQTLYVPQTRVNNSSGVLSPPFTQAQIDAVDLSLNVSPVESVAPNGALVLSPGATVTANWPGLDRVPGSMVEFILTDTLSDGGVMSLGTVITSETQAAALSFTVPDALNGELWAGARLPGQQHWTLETIRLRVETPGISTGTCEFYTAAVGPIQNAHTQPDLTSTPAGSLALDVGYPIVGRVDGVDDKGGTIAFFTITYNGTTAYSRVAGGSARGACGQFVN